MANKVNEAEMPTTERPIAPVPTPMYHGLSPREMQLERQGGQTSGYSRRFPEVRGGICEYCGVIDGNQPSEFQYKLCAHYRGMQLSCVYCPASKNQDDVINHSILNIAEHPENPNKLVVWCNSYECSRAHEQRFKRTTA